MKNSLGMKRFILALLLFSTISHADEMMWFSPNDPTHGGATDVMSLFTAGAPWSKASMHVQVYKMTPHFATAAPDNYLQAVFAYLKQNQIALALEWGILTKTSTCATSGVEGYSLPTEASVTAKRIQRLGGNLQYIAMDEPLYYGHYYTGTGACQSPVANLVADAMVNIQEFQAVFPLVQVGDIEPLGAMPSDGLSMTKTWIESFRAAYGKPMAFFHADVIWNKPLAAQIQPLQSLLSSEQVPFGVIFNSAPAQYNSHAWMVSARHNIRAFNTGGFGRPTHVILQTWDPYPDHMLPETDSTAFTSLIDFYFSPSSSWAPPVPFYRFYNASLNRHFYSASATEQASLLLSGWKSEGSVGEVYTSVQEEAGLVPLYRLFNGTTKDHLFTTDANARALALLSGYVSEGNAGYIFPPGSSVGPALYQAQSTVGGSFYTPYSTEYGSLSNAWTKDGIACQMIP